MASQEEDGNFPATELKDRGCCHLSDKEFTIAVMMKFSEAQENSERQLSDLKKKKINEHKNYLIKETEILKKKTLKLWSQRTQ